MKGKHFSAVMETSFINLFWNKGVKDWGPGRALEIICPTATTMCEKGKVQLTVYHTSEFC